MFGLIVLVLFGAIIAYFATQNTSLISIQFADSVFRNVPTYVVVLASVLAGLILAWILSLINAVNSMLDMMGKNRTIKEKDKNVTDLKERIRDLELENAALRAERKRLNEEKV